MHGALSSVPLIMASPSRQSACRSSRMLPGGHRLPFFAPNSLRGSCRPGAYRAGCYPDGSANPLNCFDVSDATQEADAFKAFNRHFCTKLPEVTDRRCSALVQVDPPTLRPLLPERSSCATPFPICSPGCSTAARPSRRPRPTTMRPIGSALRKTRARATPSSTTHRKEKSCQLEWITKPSTDSA